MNFYPLGQRESRGTGWGGATSSRLGAIGAARFTTGRGGTGRAGRPGAASPESPPATPRRRDAHPAPVSGYVILELMRQPALMVANADVQSPVVRMLGILGEAMQGDLDKLPGAREALDNWLDEQPTQKLEALWGGPLGHPGACRALESKITHDPHGWAVSLLNEVALAFKQYLARERVGGPLMEMVKLLPGPGAGGDAAGLEAELLALQEQLDELDVRAEEGRWPAVDMLDIYLQSLSNGQSERLLIALRPERLDTVHALLSQRYGHPEARRERTLAPFVMLVRLRAALEREVHARARPGLRQLHEALELAASTRDRRVASQVLRELHAFVDMIRQTFGPLPEELSDDVRKLVIDCLTLLRDAERHPTGPLTDSFLKSLDDFTLNHLHQISGLLHPWGLGLALGLDAAKAVGLQRVEALRRQAVEAMMAMFCTLSAARANMQVFVQQLQELASVEWQCLQQMEDLGQFISGRPNQDERRDWARNTCMEAMGRLIDEGPVFSVDDALRHIGLLRDMARRYFMISYKLESVIAQGDYQKSGGKIREHLVTCYHLLNGMDDAMRARTGASLFDTSRQASAVSVASFLSSIFYPALRDQYELVYKPDTGEVVLLVTDTARAEMAPELETLPPLAARGIRQATLLVNGMDRTFAVNTQFHTHGIENASVVLSVRGVGIDGQDICFTWPDPVFPYDRRQTMGRALDALFKLAGASAEALTHLMAYEHVYAAVQRGLRGMGRGSPFKLPDDTVVHVEDGGVLGFDVAQAEGGGFLITTTVGFPGIEFVRGTRLDNADVGIRMNPWSSWAQIQYTLHVSADVQQIRVVELPQFRHHFEVMAIKALTST